MQCKETIADSERYTGRTRTTIHARMLGHLRDQRSKSSKSPMHRHDTDKHNGVPQKYVTDIIGRERKLVRLNCLEAIHIEKQPSHLSMNARQEEGRGGIVPISATRVG